MPATSCCGTSPPFRLTAACSWLIERSHGCSIFYPTLQIAYSWSIPDVCVDNPYIFILFITIDIASVIAAVATTVVAIAVA